MNEALEDPAGRLDARALGGQLAKQAKDDMEKSRQEMIQALRASNRFSMRWLGKC